MKKIILMFLILLLVSGCDKANTLKPIQPVKNQIIQSDDNQVSQPNNNQAVQLNNNQNTETNKQTHYLTGSTVAYIVGGVVILALVGYAVYRHYHSVPVNSSNPLKLQAGRLYTIDDILYGCLIPSDVNLFTEQECLSLNFLNNLVHPEQRVYAFLSEVCSIRYNRYLRYHCSSDLPEFFTGNHNTDICIMLNEFNKEVAYRRSLAELQPA
ncbi:MAG: hypothetical protein LBN01_05150 [Endomicrobium sp.]|nr:hypothetical protein [Endomicrobium sp.]